MDSDTDKKEVLMTGLCPTGVKSRVSWEDEEKHPTAKWDDEEEQYVCTGCGTEFGEDEAAAEESARKHYTYI